MIKKINSNSETLDKKITQLQLPTFSNVPRGKTKGKENDKTRSLQTDRALLEGLLLSHSKDRLTVRNYLLMSLQVYLWLLQILMAQYRKPTRRKSCMF